MITLSCADVLAGKAPADTGSKDKKPDDKKPDDKKPGDE